MVKIFRIFFVEGVSVLSWFICLFYNMVIVLYYGNVLLLVEGYLGS